MASRARDGPMPNAPERDAHGEESWQRQVATMQAEAAKACEYHDAELDRWRRVLHSAKAALEVLERDKQKQAERVDIGG
jgi:hypothetical protein